MFSAKNMPGDFSPIPDLVRSSGSVTRRMDAASNCGWAGANAAIPNKVRTKRADRIPVDDAETGQKVSASPEARHPRSGRKPSRDFVKATNDG
jgi:hypothetical protein